MSGAEATRAWKQDDALGESTTPLRNADVRGACSHEPSAAYFPLILLFEALRGLILACCWLCESHFECVAKLH